MRDRDGGEGAGGEDLDLEVVELLVEMARLGLHPAMIVFLGGTGPPRVAARGVDPGELLRDLARESVAQRPCRRKATTH